MKVVDRRWWANREDGAETPPAEAPAFKPTYVEQLEQQLAEKDALLQSYIVKYRDGSKEFEEARIRLRREVSKEVERGRRAMLADLLEVVDNLDRAIDAARSEAAASPLMQGVEMVRRQFLAKLSGLGVTRIEPLHQPFDPSRHEAVTTVLATSPEQDGMVVGVIAHGYVIGDDVLRPASVAVARGRAQL
ncbi:MAG: nucleotide exchange factor GrpE [Acidobacteria bacterium]|nr:nucleotide exchange factor GrpE [Acidobacteriota bacterium]